MEMSGSVLKAGGALLLSSSSTVSGDKKSMVLSEDATANMGNRLTCFKAKDLIS